MNARHAMRLLAKCAADARECYPSDRDRRAHFFVASLSRELKRPRRAARRRPGRAGQVRVGGRSMSAFTVKVCLLNLAPLNYFAIGAGSAAVAEAEARRFAACGACGITVKPL
ncbi:hypothetical protein [Rugamonas sp. DEMB1]|uniref:hypothetical protein n=1 Tax=Rugamonas sp. DEMB1 TaxID=3039386 RepID=UPI002449A447|nr:hypothetical protein [Rugamonas sp. DEMB1]WGG51805.1 hypothetical protein QC826_06180 [Rugamonas sp. DEMB1]